MKHEEFRIQRGVARSALSVAAFLLLCEIPCENAYAEASAVPKRKTHVALRHLETYGHKGSGAGEFLHPHDVAIDAAGNILVADTGNHRIVKLNAKGSYLTEVGGFGWDDRQFNEPSGVSTGTGLEIYVSDQENQRVALYSQHLKLISIVGGRDVGGTLAMGKVGGVATTREGEIYVTDQDLDQVIQVSTFSRTDRSFGGYGYGSGELRAPSAVDVNTEGFVYVCDTENDRVAVFDRFGNYERELGAEVLTRPEGVVAGPSGVLFVSDTGSHRVFVFDVDKDEVVGRMGGPKRGTGPGQFDTPRGLTFDLRSNALLVVDSGNHRLQKFKTLILKK